MSAAESVAERAGADNKLDLAIEFLISFGPCTVLSITTWKSIGILLKSIQNVFHVVSERTSSLSQVISQPTCGHLSETK